MPEALEQARWVGPKLVLTSPISLHWREYQWGGRKVSVAVSMDVVSMDVSDEEPWLPKAWALTY